MTSSMNERLRTAPGWDIIEGDYYEAGEEKPAGAYGRRAFSAPESLFALADGYLGLRGAADEIPRSPGDGRGTYVNGYYERSPIAYGEDAYGYARWHETIVDLPDGLGVELEIGGRPLAAVGRLESQGRRLDLADGVLYRRARWRLASGAALEIRSSRFVSLAEPGLAFSSLELRCDESIHVSAAAGLRHAIPSGEAGSSEQEGHPPGTSDPRIAARGEGAQYAVGGSEAVLLAPTAGAAGGARAAAALGIRTKGSGLGMGIAVALEGALVAGGPAEAGPAIETKSDDPLGPSVRFAFRLDPGAAFQLRRSLCYRRDPASGAGVRAAPADGDPESLKRSALEAATAAAERDPRASLAAHAAELASFWDAVGFEMDGPDGLAAALRFNFFHVFQAAGRDGITNLPAKGLTGEGYEGHYFWDTEIYFLPLLGYARPDVAKALLSYRAAALPAARARARELGGRPGALFAWRSISGAETSAYYPAGTAQYHVNADVAYAVMRYLAASGDEGFLCGGGGEILAETARHWLALGHYGRDGRFRIERVTGPDEYSAVVDNNAYTNYMARHNLRGAADALAGLESRDPAAYAALADRLALDARELDAWRAAADAMYLPFDEASGVIPQDDGFLDRERWDFEATPPEKYPLLLHYHPLDIYRKQVLKQPDLLLAELLLASEFGAAQKRRDYAYYEALTTGDSSLSHCVMSVMAAEAGRIDDAWDYFMKTATLDLDDLHGNSAHGAHVAAMGGSWLSLAYGFAGFRDDGGSYRFAPRLPEPLKSLRFNLNLRGGRLSVSVTPDEARYSWLGPAPLILRHFSDEAALNPGQEAAFDLRPKLKAVIFDLDGVIADTARLHFLAWKRLADEEGWPFDEAANEALKGRSRLESLELLLGERASAYSAAEKETLAERKNGYYRELLAGLAPSDALPGARELVAELKSAGVKLGLASASRNAPEVVARLGLADAFDAVADPARCRPKPDPEIFLSVAEALGVRPADCVGVEDAQAGVDAVVAAGMRAVGIGAGLRGAELIARRLTELDVGALSYPLTT